ncbi:hypothetical protein CAPTEDRAFT_187706 [Capitella teleta]|uniref:Uncharacterized protein n=1 Tax=Capitella teleta TaxID=283909 RepID=R7T540_CAPTE|nr:hypothetical protein CAPTEDRAFT_187706 [Capitella teleta]|eukprot:ELT88302.1 hypothetical protein CAPTEDRAFT_187706 [Capitella teleta]
MGNRCCKPKHVSSDGLDKEVEICCVDGVGRDNLGLEIEKQEFNHYVNGPVIQESKSATSLDVVSRDPKAENSEATETVLDNPILENNQSEINQYVNVFDIQLLISQELQLTHENATKRETHKKRRNNKDNRSNRSSAYGNVTNVHQSYRKEATFRASASDKPDKYRKGAPCFMLLPLMRPTLSDPITGHNIARTPRSREQGNGESKSKKDRIGRIIKENRRR